MAKRTPLAFFRSKSSKSLRTRTAPPPTRTPEAKPRTRQRKGTLSGLTSSFNGIRSNIGHTRSRSGTSAGCRTAPKRTCAPNTRGLQRVFGSDPAKMQRILSHGHNVPWPLAVLLSEFDRLNASKEEGIFRMSGSEQEMHQILTLFDKGIQNVQIRNPHSAATLIKRYLAQLPSGLFSYVPQDIYQRSYNKEQNALQNFSKSLPDLQAHIFMRLMALFTEVLRHEQANKMSINNIATVFGPPLAPKKGTDIMYSLQETSKSCVILQALMQIHCKNRY
eukprot:TRINITY_DN12217_c0_g1_i1.p1 TRINITY_DN12217_c0_g1~~TRINITY_DN12217_c0_g1_i1.p1  ORF type:complete len:277 (-),score=1.65 TRINITY_DN12217_c0_g1_i1:1-831(-)